MRSGGILNDHSAGVHPEISLGLALSPDQLPPQMLDVHDVAHWLQVDTGWVYRNAERLKATRLGDGPKARLRFKASEVKAYLERGFDEHQSPSIKSVSPPQRRPRSKRSRSRTVKRGGGDYLIPRVERR